MGVCVSESCVELPWPKRGIDEGIFVQRKKKDDEGIFVHSHVIMLI